MDVEGFRDYCQSQVDRQGGGMSQSTADTYIPIVERFNDWYGGSGEPGSDDVQDWVRYLEVERRVSNSTIQKYFTAVQKYFYFKRRLGDLEQLTRWVGDQYPKGGSDTPDAFTDDELEALRDAAADNPRQNAVVAILSTIGCRVSELVELKTSSITWSDNLSDEERDDLPDWMVGSIEIHRHKRMEDVHDKMPLAAYEASAIKEYLDSRDEYVSKIGVESDWLFPSIHKGEVRHISTQTARNIVNNVAEKADGLGKEDVHPHKFRHTVASNLGRNQWTAEQIAKYLGQKNSESAKTYTHLDRTQVMEMRDGMV